MKKLLVMIAVMFSLPLTAHAISYWKSEDGKIVKIDSDAFDKCEHYNYRSSAKEELSPKHKRALLQALLQGNAINDLSAAASWLQKNPGTCSYGTDAEKFE